MSTLARPGLHPDAVRADRAVLRAAHPVAFPLLRLADRLGPAVRVPGVGVLVNDPDLVRQVLTDSTRFRKDGPGSPGELWTPVVGPRALTNMEGTDHRQLRTALTGLLGPGYAAELVERSAAGVLAGLASDLRSGRPVDLADRVRALVGAVVLGLVGIRLPEPDCAELVRRGAALTATVGPRTRRLTVAQAAHGRRVLAAVTGPAALAWDAGLDPGGDGTVPGRMRRAGLDRDDACGVAGVLFLTGTETVSSFLPRAVALLAGSGLLAPDTLPDTLADLGPLLDEALRVTVPTPATLRRAELPGRVGPVDVRPGERLLVATLNAAWAPRPTEELRQVWFGAGTHFCLGRGLALAQARALLTTLAGVVAATGGPVRVVRCRPARGVLIPNWRELWISIGAR